MEIGEKHLITRMEAVEYFGISERTLDKLYRTDPDFPIVRVGKRVMIKRKLAEDYMNNRQRVLAK